MRVAIRRVLLLLALGIGGRWADGAEIIGHRGAPQDHPENTIASFKEGYAQGSDGDELDIHLSKDGRIVVIHDGNTKRVAGVDKKVVEQSFDELRQLNVARFEPWTQKGITAQIPTLEEVLALVPAGKKLYIEIKTHAEIIPALERVLAQAPVKPSQTVIISFQFDAIIAAKKAFPDRRAYWLASWAKDKKTGQYPDLGELISRAKKAGLDGLDLDYHFPLDKAAIARIHEAGLRCEVWTVDDPAIARRLIADGVDGITTNRPGALREALDSEARRQ